MPTITPSLTLRNTFATSTLNALDAGSTEATCSLYTGTKPAGPEVAVPAGSLLLGTLICAMTSGSVNNGRLTFVPFTQDPVADNTGTATWARFRSNGGATVDVLDVDVGSTGSQAFLQMNSTSVIAGGPITCTSCYIDF